MVRFNLAGLLGVLLAIPLAFALLGVLDALHVLNFRENIFGIFGVWALAAACFGSFYDRVPRGKRLESYLSYDSLPPNSRVRIAYAGGPLIGLPYVFLALSLIILCFSWSSDIVNWAIWSAATCAAAFVIGLLTIPLRTLPDKPPVPAPAADDSAPDGT